MRGTPLVDLARNPRSVLAVFGLQIGDDWAARFVVAHDVGRDEAGYERYHDDSAISRDSAQDRVGNVARNIDQRSRSGMRENYRRPADVQCVAHRARRDVRQIDQHAQPVHLAHDAVAERRQATVLGGIERGIGPVESHVVGKRHVAHAEVVVRAQCTK